MIFLILVLATALRLINLNQSLWLDEAAQVMLSSQPLYNIFFLRGADFHPPLAYLLMHFWMLLGIAEIWLRLPSVILGVLTVWVLYQFTRQFLDKKVALLSALFLAISPYHVYYSQEIRMYALAAFLATLSMYFFYRRFALGYILATAGLLYTHYFGFFILVSQASYLLFFERKKIKFFLKYFLVILLIWLPWLPQFLIQLKSGLAVEGTLSGWSRVLNLSPEKIFPLTLLKFSLGRFDFEYSIPHLFLAALVLLFISYLLFRAFRENLRLVYAWLAVPLVLAFLISLFVPIYQPFRLLLILPAFYILIAAALLRLAKWRFSSIMLMILISLTGLFISFNPKYQREDWRGATNFIKQVISEDAQVIFAWPEPFPPYKWYGGSQNSSGDPSEIFFFEYLQQLSDPQGLIKKGIEEKGFKEYNVYNFNGVGFIYHFKK